MPYCGKKKYGYSLDDFLKMSLIHPEEEKQLRT
jgi:hypothetical protein